MKKWLKIIVFQGFVAAYKDVFIIIAPFACLISYLLFDMAGLACIIISLPFSHYFFKKFCENDEYRQGVKELEEFLEKMKQQ